MQTVGKPITIRGVTYPSRKAAAAALGIQPSSLYLALDKGTEQYAGLGRNYRQLVPVKCGDKEFPSIVSAARALNTTAKLIRVYGTREGRAITLPKRFLTRRDYMSTEYQGEKE